MKNGLYSARFGTPLGTGAGVVVLRDGVIRGGDSMMYYIGSYAISGSQLSAEIEVDVHTRQQQMASVFGRDRVSVKLVGAFSADTATLKGSSPQAPGVAFSAELRKLSD
ncbi:hypothetical protein QFZ27_005796 [Inquilinus ginsengisoli]|uniref:hypothetical protein n=1 Tax=Inquilinus ginsengisoli TaxID=363840 RepID=UPI003D1C0D26